jgi:mRNA-degrading endonuclease HigB of HigAB toxin-antitoxin module
MTKLLYHLLFILIITACAREDNGPLPVVNIADNIHNMDQLELSELAYNIRYIALEPDSTHPIRWSSIELFDFGEEYIIDSDGKTCLLYNTQGQFIRPIGKEGRGPGEYRLIIDVFLINEKIYIRDFMDLLEYNIDGSFVNRVKNAFLINGKYPLEEVVMINDSVFFGNVENRTGTEEYKAFVIDCKGYPIHSFKNYCIFELESGVNSVKAPGKSIIYKYANDVFFKEFYNDTLFKLDELYNLRPAYVFDLADRGEPASKIGLRWDQKDLSAYIYISYIYQTASHLVINCDFNKFYKERRISPEIIKTPSGKDYIQWYNYTGQQVLGIYNKINGNLVFSKPTSTNNQLFTSGFYNDYDAGPRFFPDKMINDSVLVMKIRPDHLFNHIESNDFKDNYSKCPDKKNELKIFVDSLRRVEYDNPIYMLVTFKK